MYKIISYNELTKIFKYPLKKLNYFLKTGFVFKFSSELKGSLLGYYLMASIVFLGNDQSSRMIVSALALTSHRWAGRPHLCQLGHFVSCASS